MAQRVYRIETREGRGICAATGSPLCTIYRMAGGREEEHCSFPCSGHNRQVWRRMDSDPGLVFAFPTLEALEHWFPSSRGRAAMAAAGALGVEYETDHVEMSSPFQCVFDRRSARRIGEFGLS